MVARAIQPLSLVTLFYCWILISFTLDSFPLFPAFVVILLLRFYGLITPLNYVLRVTRTQNVAYLREDIHE